MTADPMVDRGTARRILEGAQPMAAMVQAAAAAAKAAAAAGKPQAPDDDDDAAGPEGTAAGAGSLDPADAAPDRSSEEEEEEGESTAAAWAGDGAGRDRGTALSREAFEKAWQEQMVAREGIVGALVAAAYPDRIAERKDRSNKRATFTLAAGRAAHQPAAGANWSLCITCISMQWYMPFVCIK